VDNGLANKIILAGCGRLMQTTLRESFRKQNVYNRIRNVYYLKCTVQCTNYMNSG